ncbi:MAG TPA: chloride channel protein [Solirubrobacteraceae bacterium]|nr:chloride channel protein [Solirubrobacteraceae bacterium]
MVAELTPQQAAATMTSKRFIVLLVVVAVVGVIVSLAAWCFLELIYQLQRELYTHLPNALGYKSGPPLWWPLPVLAVAGLLVALAIKRLPGEGGHLPAKGLAIGGGLPRTIDLPGVILAGLATVGSGLVLGPEGPLIALGSGTALLAIKLARREMPQEILVVVAAAGSFSALAFIFASPLIAAVILIEATAIGGTRLQLVLVPGLLAAGIGTLVALGMGSFTGLSTTAFALGALQLPHFGHPDIAEFGWTIAVALAIAVVARIVMTGGLGTYRVVSRRLLLFLPAVGLIVAGLAIAFHGATGKNVNEVLFSGQDALPGIVSQAATWSVSALLLLIAFKGLAWSISLGSFRGGPTFPALFLGAAAGIAASHLPGFSLTPAVAVGMGAAATAVLRLPLSGAVMATLLTAHSGTGDEPLIIVAVVAAYLVSLVPLARAIGEAPDDKTAPPAESPPVETAVAAGPRSGLDAAGG